MDRAPAHEPSRRRPSSDAASQREHQDDVAVNPTWQGMAMGIGMATGPRVGRPNDPLEREADAIAEQALAGSTRVSGWTQLGLRSTAPVIQRACQACQAEEEIQREATGPTSSHAGLAIGATLTRRAGQGRPLDAGLRASFESRLGADLSRVRTHTDGEAQQSARELQARAFTWGSDVYFGPGAWAPESRSGQRLIAHELAHVLQQGQGRTQAIQREPEFRVLDEVEPTARGADDRNRVYFDFDSAVIEASQDTALTELIDRLRAEAPSEIFLTGMASEEGRGSRNRTLATQRMAAVEQRLRAAGFNNILRRPIGLAEAEGQIGYRRQRFVQVDTAAPAPGAITCSAATSASDLTACESSFTTSHPIATAICEGAIETLRTLSGAALQTAQDNAGVATQRELFDLVVRVQAVVTQMGGPTGHDCHDRCDTGCSTTAHGGPNSISLCRPYYDDAQTSAELRPWVLIHEAAHGTGEFTDIQYHHQPGFRVLDTGVREFNADSITRVIVELGDRSRRTWNARRMPPARTASGLSAADDDRMSAGLGALRMALVLSAFDQTFYYQYVRQAQTANAWPCASSTPTPGNNRTAANAIRGRFEMTGAPATALADTCAAPVGPGPGANDHVRMAAIVDRLTRMGDAASGDVDITQVASLGAPRWRQVGAGWALDIPSGYPGARSSDDVAHELFRALIAVMPNVELRFAADYEHIAFASPASRMAGLSAIRANRRGADPHWGELPPPASTGSGSTGGGSTGGSTGSTGSGPTP
ncbi:eCIS core domain-containing protein [Nannocystaceae bacterium ST9]